MEGEDDEYYQTFEATEDRIKDFCLKEKIQTEDMDIFCGYELLTFSDNE
jgi:hypothetical protein